MRQFPATSSRQRRTKKRKYNRNKSSHDTTSNNKTSSLCSWNKWIIFTTVVSVLILLYLFFAPQTELHDLLVIINYGDRIYTMNDQIKHKLQTHSFCVDLQTRKFLHIGDSSRQVIMNCKNTDYKSMTVIDASKYAILPGLIDSHAHLMFQASLSSNVDLRNAKTFKECMQKINKYISKNNVKEGEWVNGVGWDEKKWKDWDSLSHGKELPDRFNLDKYFPKYKLSLYRTDLHTIWINTLALKSIEHSLPKDIDNIEGGAINKNQDGVVNGLFVDKAKKFVTRFAHPYYSDQNDNDNVEMKAKLLQNVIKECNMNGLTGVHDMDEKVETIENLYKYLIDKDVNQTDFTLRINVYVHGSGDSYDTNQNEHKTPSKIENISKYFLHSERLTVNGVKLFLDGALGSYGAKLKEPYCDKPDSDGIMIYSDVQSYYNDIDKWHKQGWQIATHCIGDRANQIALDSYSKLIDNYALSDQEIKGLRLRIEHAQIIDLKDIGKFSKLHVIPVMQPSHATDDMKFAHSRLECSSPKNNKNKKYNRMFGAYAWQSLLDSGVEHLAFGSDFPAVGRVNPFLGIFAAVSRQDMDGFPRDGWYGKERVSMYQAVKGYTMDAAYASFQEKYVGSIQEGKYADFVIIDRDIFALYEDKELLDIADTKVVATFFGGKMVYHDQSFPLVVHNY